MSEEEGKVSEIMIFCTMKTEPEKLIAEMACSIAFIDAVIETLVEISNRKKALMENESFNRTLN